MDLSEFVEGASVQTKKPHACGGDRWRIVRRGADVRIRCLTCGREICLLPDELKKRIRRTEGKA